MLGIQNSLVQMGLLRYFRKSLWYTFIVCLILLCRVLDDAQEHALEQFTAVSTQQTPKPKH